MVDEWGTSSSHHLRRNAKMVAPQGVLALGVMSAAEFLPWADSDTADSDTAEAGGLFESPSR